MGILEQIVLSIFSSSIVAAAFVFLLKTKLTESIRHDYARRLESFRHELKSDHELALQQLRHDAELMMAKTSAVAEAFKDVHLAAYDRRLEAIAQMWSVILAIQGNAPAFLIWAEVVTREVESELFERHPEIRKVVLGFSMDNASEMMEKTCQQVEKCRPFLGEPLYAMFFAYRAFNMRVAYALHESAKNHSKRSWRDDPGVRQILKAVLNAEEFGEIDAKIVGAFNAARNMMERKMLNHVAQLVSGEASVDTTLQALQKIEADTKLQTTEQPSADSGQ